MLDLNTNLISIDRTQHTHTHTHVTRYIMPMTLDYTLTPPKGAVTMKRKRVPSLRVPRNEPDAPQAGRDKPLFPFVRVEHDSAGGLEPDDVFLLWQLRAEDGSEVLRCARCQPAPVNMLQFRQRGVFKRIYERGTPQAGFLDPSTDVGMPVEAALDGSRGTAGPEVHGVLAYGKLEPPSGKRGGRQVWSSTFKVSIQCNSHFHDNLRFRLYTQAVVVRNDAAGEPVIVALESAATAPIQVVSKFLDPVDPEPDDPAQFPASTANAVGQGMVHSLVDAVTATPRPGRKRRRSAEPDLARNCLTHDHGEADSQPNSPPKRAKALDGSRLCTRCGGPASASLAPLIPPFLPPNSPFSALLFSPFPRLSEPAFPSDDLPVTDADTDIASFLVTPTGEVPMELAFPSQSAKLPPTDGPELSRDAAATLAMFDALLPGEQRRLLGVLGVAPPPPM